jgi:Cd2+/Zn2+-exporting ATPase
LENLSFDLINGRMSVTGATDAAHHPRIFKAIERTGMSAELWQEGDRISALKENSADAESRLC